MRLYNVFWTKEQFLSRLGALKREHQMFFSVLSKGMTTPEQVVPTLRFVECFAYHDARDPEGCAEVKQILLENPATFSPDDLDEIVEQADYPDWPEKWPREWKYNSLPEDWDWDMPILKTPEDIFKRFPVVVKEISNTGTGMFSIQWHKKKYDERRDNCHFGWQYMDFEDDIERHLMKALLASEAWTVKPARTADEFCVVVLKDAVQLVDEDLPAVHDTDVASAASDAEWTAVPVSEKKPAFTKISDIGKVFPIVWNEVSDKVFEIKYNMKKVRDGGLKIHEVEPELMKRLKSSPGWKVLEKRGAEVCRIEMQ